MESQNPLMRVFLNAYYCTPFNFWGWSKHLSEKKVCQRHFSFDVSIHKSNSDARLITRSFETVVKNKEKSEKTRKKRKSMKIKEYTYKKGTIGGNDYAI